FLAIFTSNLDEFFMKRMALLREGQTEPERELLERLREKLLAQIGQLADCYCRHLIPLLAARGIVLRRWEELSRGQQDEARHYFEANVSPALTPLVIDPTHPFPFLSNLSTSLVFRLGDASTHESIYGRVKVPGDLKQWVRLDADSAAGHTVFVPLCDVIRGSLDALYRGMAVTAITVVRLTRDAEIEIEGEAGTGLREAIEEQVRLRRYEPVVRLEFGPGAGPALPEPLRARCPLPAPDLPHLPARADV